MNLSATSACIAQLCLLSVLGCSSNEGLVCATYACNNRGVLSGTVELSTAKVVDVRFCEDFDCRDGLIDLESLDNDRACATWQYNLQACFFPSAGSGTYAVEAVWGHDELLPEGSHTLKLIVTDHTTGAELVSEARAIEYEVTRKDACHLCFAAQAEL